MGERIVVNTPSAEQGPAATAEELEWLKAVDAYRRRRPFPTWREVLALLRSLGYRKLAPAGPPPEPRLPRAARDGGARRRKKEGPPRTQVGVAGRVGGRAGAG